MARERLQLISQTTSPGTHHRPRMCQKGALAQARVLADAKDIMNVDFIEGDATGLVFANSSLAVVFCHQF